MSVPTADQIAAAFHRAWWEQWGEEPNEWVNVQGRYREKWIGLAEAALTSADAMPAVLLRDTPEGPAILGRAIGSLLPPNEPEPYWLDPKRVIAALRGER